MKNLEIEKRYLVKGGGFDRLDDIEPYIVADSEVVMNDYYVPNGDEHKDLRLRHKGDRYVITRKRPIKEGDTTTMMETTIPLSSEEFTALSSGISTNVQKSRYTVDMLGRQADLDIFSGRHDGLIVIEFEFKDESDLAKFMKEARLDLPDVTNVEWLAGGRLAETSLKDIESKLKSLNK